MASLLKETQGVRYFNIQTRIHITNKPKGNRGNVQWEKELPKLESKGKNTTQKLDDNSREISQSSPTSTPPQAASPPLPGLLWHRSAPSPLTCMFSGVGDERTRDGEGFSTAVTHIGFLPGVATHVVGERAGLSKPLTTPIAHVGLLAAVLPANEHRHQGSPGREGSNTRH